MCLQSQMFFDIATRMIERSFDSYSEQNIRRLRRKNTENVDGIVYPVI